MILMTFKILGSKRKHKIAVQKVMEKDKDKKECTKKKGIIIIAEKINTSNNILMTMQTIRIINNLLINKEIIIKIPKETIIIIRGTLKNCKTIMKIIKMK